MGIPITYDSKFAERMLHPISHHRPSAADLLFKVLTEELDWLRRDGAPRMEYYCNEVPVPYTYGRGRGERTYEVQPWHPALLLIKTAAEQFAGCKFEVCFLNRYLDQRDQLGRHADDSPEMDDKRPIAIVTFGAERDIQFSPQTNPSDITKVKLEHGSICLMHAGMQDTHFHSIPRAGFECGERISLTFRGYVNGTV